MATITTAAELEDALARIVRYGDDYDGLDVQSVTTFDDAGILTRDRGIVVQLTNGAEFQVTIVQSERADDASFDDDEE